MAEVKRKWDLLTKEKRTACVGQIVAYFKAEKNQEIGVIAAEGLLDFFLEMLTEDIYNKALGDAKTLLKQGLENLEVDLDLLLNK